MPASVRHTEASSHAELAVALIIARGSSPAPFSKLGLYDHEIQWIRTEAELPFDAGIQDVAAAFLKKHLAIEKTGQARLRALAETGYADWYSWSIANWGTKWGAYRYREIEAADDYTFLFETAWDFPTPIFTKLAAELPGLAFHCATYDEGSCFAGQGWFNPPEGEQPFTIGKATDELYEMVHGQPCPVNDDE